MTSTKNTKPPTPNVLMDPLTAEEINKWAARLPELLGDLKLAKLAILLATTQKVGIGRVYIDVDKGEVSFIGIDAKTR